MRRRAALALPLLLAAGAARAIGLPPRYGATIVQPQGLPEQYEFDLGPALARARAENKRLYVYLGANDCPFCRKYEAFLDKNADALLPHFQKDWLLYDLRSSLKVQADRLRFRIGAQSWGYTEFMKKLGDERVRQLVYPSVWLLDGEGRNLMQMPAGTGTFETVPEQLEILRLEN
ncbi:thioredoxin family protein [Piscinibacter defluvii]|uniref:thioredoxin family protein n=1 Tax=Piscinibacter defluvii TaxID=1796922 RepID=UPI000FDEAFD6|nr:thioredoxin family protein [Piscinibacter defluvii]